MRLNVTHGHPAGVERHDHRVQTVQAAGTFRDQPRFERASPIPRRVDRHVADLGRECLRCRTVTRVRAAPPGRIAPLVPEVITQLDRHAPFQHPRDQLGQKPTRPGQPDLAVTGRGEQLIQRLLIEQLPTQPGRRPIPITTSSHRPSLTGIPTVVHHSARHLGHRSPSLLLAHASIWEPPLTQTI